MATNALGTVLLVAPLIAAGIVAAVNSDATNAATERAEAWARARRGRTPGGKGRYLGYVVNPLLWMIVKFCDWTDGFTHRGIKNGTRIAATLYFIAAWLYLLYIAVMVVVALAIAAVVIFIIVSILSSTSEGSTVESASDRSSRLDAVRGSKSYSKTGVFSEEETGRTDEEGRIFRKTGIFSEEEVGRIDTDGTAYRKTGIFAEEETGRTDRDGRIYKKTGMFSEEEVGRIDADGRVFKKTGLFSEEETGRIERE